MRIQPFLLQKTFTKSRLQQFLSWCLRLHGKTKTTSLGETFKIIGFHYATYAGFSLGLEDLTLESETTRTFHKEQALQQMLAAEISFQAGNLTGPERLQAILETWTLANERVKTQVMTQLGVLNPVSMMAFSGARGNIAQVRQLVGMRGLMSDAEGNLIDFPIQSNFREGLTVLEYLVSCYGSRKGVVDTALSTANSGYLTRRLVDAAQNVVLSAWDCTARSPVVFPQEQAGMSKSRSFSTGTKGRFFRGSRESTIPSYHMTSLQVNTTFLSFSSRLIGRVLARTIHPRFARANQDITPSLASRLQGLVRRGEVREPLSVRCMFVCHFHRRTVPLDKVSGELEHFCQLCYGWDYSRGQIVSLGEAIGVMAAQSIGEPGTQLTMRTFHTGGVFSGNFQNQRLQTPHPGKVWLRPKGVGSFRRDIRGQVVWVPKDTLDVLVQTEGFSSLFHFFYRNEFCLAPGKFVQASISCGNRVPPGKVRVMSVVHTPGTPAVPKAVSSRGSLDPLTRPTSLSGTQEEQELIIASSPGQTFVQNKPIGDRWSGFAVLWLLHANIDTNTVIYQSGDIRWVPPQGHSLPKRVTTQRVTTQRVTTKRVTRGEVLSPRLGQGRVSPIGEILEYKQSAQVVGWQSLHSPLLTQTATRALAAYLSPQNQRVERFTLIPSARYPSGRYGSQGPFPVLGALQLAGASTIPKQHEDHDPMSWCRPARSSTTRWVTQVCCLSPDEPLSRRTPPDLCSIKAKKDFEITTRVVQSSLFGPRTKTTVHHKGNGQVVRSGQILGKFLRNQTKTGDIVQGLPKINKMFEARRSQQLWPRHFIWDWFCYLRAHGFSFLMATKYSRLAAQKMLLNSLQSVYIDQGVQIADTHLECLVAKMTSYHTVFRTYGAFPFVPGEPFTPSMAAGARLLPLFHKSEYEHSRIFYFPCVKGLIKIGRAAEQLSFLSASSFQETRAALVQAALNGRIDRLQGMKQKIMLGQAVSLGLNSSFLEPSYYTLYITLKCLQGTKARG